MTPDPLSLTFSALGDPTRRAILARLAKGQTSVSELSKPFLKDMSAPAITKHLKVLERAGLISRTREAQWRPCSLNGKALQSASDWLEHYRVFWEESFDRLGEYLRTLQAAQPPEPKVGQATPSKIQSTKRTKAPKKKKGRRDERKK